MGIGFNLRTVAGGPAASSIFCLSRFMVSQTTFSGKGPGLWGYRSRVASRAIAAVFGGYTVSAASAAVGAVGFQWLGLSRVDATMAATMLSFVVYAVVVMGCFACVSAKRAWAGTVVPAGLLAFIAWAVASQGQP